MATCTAPAGITTNSRHTSCAPRLNPAPWAEVSRRRPAALKAQDGERHPSPTLTFFGLKPDQTVLEVWPDGYYTEILAPYLRENGLYVAADYAVSADRAPAAQRTTVMDYLQLLGSREDVYDRVQLSELARPAPAAGPVGQRLAQKTGGALVKKKKPA